MVDIKFLNLKYKFLNYMLDASIRQHYVYDDG